MMASRSLVAVRVEAGRAVEDGNGAAPIGRIKSLKLDDAIDASLSSPASESPVCQEEKCVKAVNAIQTTK